MINFFPVNINLGVDRNKNMCHYWSYSKKTLSIYMANWIPSNCYSASSIVWDFPWGDLTRLWLHELTVLYVSNSIFLTMHNIQPEFIKMISLSAVSRENTRSWNWYIAVKCINSWVLMPLLRVSSRHQKSWYSLCSIDGSSFTIRKHFNHPCRLSIVKWWKTLKIPQLKSASKGWFC